MAKSKYIKTTKKQIVDYWSDNGIPIDQLTDINFDMADISNVCWNCAKETSNAQRCHIIPRSLGGLDEPSNYVLLCNLCHINAPSVLDKNAIWDWIKNNRLDGLFMKNTYRYLKAILLLEKDYLKIGFWEKISITKEVHFPEESEHSFGLIIMDFITNNCSPYGGHPIHEVTLFYGFKLFFNKYPTPNKNQTHD